MAEGSTFLAVNRYAVVTGGNKGIGLEICRQLASQGVVVVLTARNEKKGIEAFEELKKSGLPLDNLECHQLDVTDPISIASLANFIKAKFGKLDILVNNAGILGAIADFQSMVAAGFGTSEARIDYPEFSKQMYDEAKPTLKTNYYGTKRTIEALLPLLNLSDSPRIVNVSSSTGRLQNIPSERVSEVLADVSNLTEERLDELLKEFLRDFKEGSLAEKGWPPVFSAYVVSKAAVNAYTRMLAKKQQSIMINCICPGLVETDMVGNVGYYSVEQGAEPCVRLALLPHADSPSGLFFQRNDVFPLALSMSCLIPS